MEAEISIAAIKGGIYMFTFTSLYYRETAKHYLALTSASSHRFVAPSVLCALCLKEHAQSVAPGKHGQILGSGQSNPQPTATGLT